MKTKYYIMFLALLLSLGLYNTAFAQNCLVFNYDADGNRVSRLVDYNCQDKGDYVFEQEISDETDIVIYPNPTDGCFSVVVPDYFDGYSMQYMMYDINGFIQCSGVLHVGETKVDIMVLETGIYLLKIVGGDDVYTKVIVKR